MLALWGILQAVWAFMLSPMGVGIISGLLLISEALGGIKSIAENSIYQLVLRALKYLKEKMVPAKPEQQ